MPSHHKLQQVRFILLIPSQQSLMEKHTWRQAISLSPNTLPSPRWGHASCLADGQLVIFGGYADSQYKNDLWTYDTSNMTWQQCTTSGLVPSPRSNSTLHYDAPRKRLILFGGGGPNKLRYNDVAVLDWESKEWTLFESPQGEEAPWERTYHSSELLYPYLLIFGGEGIADLGDLWAFHLQRHRWTQIKTDRSKEGPCPRRFHSSAIIGSTLLIIAGCHDKYRCLSDVYSLDLQPFLSQSRGQTLEWKEIKLKGASFLTRWGHSSSVFGGRVYIFGGRFSSDLQDILVLDPIKQTLKTMKVQGELPRPRRRHSGTFIGSNLIVFGGFNGQYFNDLNYINLFQLPHTRNSLREDFKDAALEWVNNSLLSNFSLKTKDNGVFYGHKGLIIDKMADKGQFQQFIDEIQRKYNSQQLEELFSILYCGVGRIPAHFDLANISFTLFDSYHEKQAYFKHSLTGQRVEPTLLVPKGRQSQVISLPTPSYSDFLQSRATLHTDFFITLGEYCLPANKMLLATSSKYFQYLLGHNQELTQLHLDLPQRLGDVRVLQVLVNFLERGHLVVPEGLDVDCWKSLMRLGEYFCIPIRHFCEGELIKRITHQNCEELLEFGLKESLQDLQGHCLQYTFGGLLQNGGEKLKAISQKQQKSGKETALSNFYRLWEFDLDQTDLTRKEKQAVLKPQAPAQHAKENHHVVLP